MSHHASSMTAAYTKTWSHWYEPFSQSPSLVDHEPSPTTTRYLRRTTQHSRDMLNLTPTKGEKFYGYMRRLHAYSLECDIGTITHEELITQVALMHCPVEDIRKESKKAKDLTWKKMVTIAEDFDRMNIGEDSSKAYYTQRRPKQWPQRPPLLGRPKQPISRHPTSNERQMLQVRRRRSQDQRVQPREDHRVHGLQEEGPCTQSMLLRDQKEQPSQRFELLKQAT